MIINILQSRHASGRYHILLYDILGLPVDELTFHRIEVDSDHRDLLRGLKILLEVGFFLDLRQRGIVIVQLELKQIDVIVRLDNRIDPSIVRAGLRFDVESEQPEDRVEDGLERRFTLLVDRIRHPCEERFENLPRLIQIALQERGKIAISRFLLKSFQEESSIYRNEAEKVCFYPCRKRYFRSSNRLILIPLLYSLQRPD